MNLNPLLFSVIAIVAGSVPVKKLEGPRINGAKDILREGEPAEGMNPKSGAGRKQTDEQKEELPKRGKQKQKKVKDNENKAKKTKKSKTRRRRYVFGGALLSLAVLGGIAAVAAQNR